MNSTKVVLVIGAGPIGIEMALALVRSKAFNVDVIVVERGSDVGCHITEHWADVTLFSPNYLNVSQTGLEVLSEFTQDASCQQLDPAKFSTGGEFVEKYLKPVAAYLRANLKCSLLFNSTVVAASRKNLNKGTLPRLAGKFEVMVDCNGSERYLECDYLVDCSGTVSTPNFAGKGGMPAVGERSLRAAGKINYHIPVAAGAGAQRKNHVVVIGAGTSAITSINRCLSDSSRDCQITWVTRTDPRYPPYDRIENDPLPQRDSLFAQGNALAAASAPGAAVQYRGFSDVLRIQELPESSSTFRFRVTLQKRAADGEAPAAPETVDCHEVVANTGYRPDMAVLAELQVHYCFASDGPMRLAAALLASSGGTSGNCLAQVVPGKDTLRTPEPRLFIIGIKSYGRGNAFLLRIGYEQVQHVMELIADEEGVQGS
jgi:cation diffusion facilitator CzcD-associated flavoprotein CzcO